MKNISNSRITALAVFAILLSLGSAFAGSSFSGRSAISSVDNLHIVSGIKCHTTQPAPIITTETLYVNRTVSVGGPFKVMLEYVSMPNETLNKTSNVSFATFSIMYDGKTIITSLEPGQESNFRSDEGTLSLKLNSDFQGLYTYQDRANITTIYRPLPKVICIV